MPQSAEQLRSQYADFTQVTSKNRKNRKSNLINDSPNTTHLFHVTRYQLRTQEDDWRIQSLRLLEAVLRTSTSSPVDRLQVLCLGLGSPSSSSIARVQLAFLVELCEYFNIDHSNIAIYDPVFTAEDGQLFDTLNMLPLAENRNARHTLTSPTICFMPHCDLELYENLLTANWTQESLSNILLISNRFTDYVESNPAHKLRARAPYLLRLAPFLQCKDLPQPKLWPNAFNNTSIQYLIPSCSKTPIKTAAIPTALAVPTGPTHNSSSTAACIRIGVVHSEPHDGANIKENNKGKKAIEPVGDALASDWAAALFDVPVVSETDRPTQEDG